MFSFFFSKFIEVTCSLALCKMRQSHLAWPVPYESMMMMMKVTWAGQGIDTCFACASTFGEVGKEINLYVVGDEDAVHGGEEKL